MLQIVLSPDSGTPLVDQIVTAIRTRIDDRILHPGARLPPIRQFAEQYGVSRFTVVEAYDRLVALGHLQSRRVRLLRDQSPPAGPRGPVRRSHGADHRRRLADARDGRGRPGPHPRRLRQPARRLARRSRRAARAAGPVATRRRAPGELRLPQGYAPLRAQLQVRLAEIGIGATPGQIVLTYGVHQALDIICRYFLKPGDCVLVDDPGYWNLFGNLRLYGVALLGVPRTPDGPDTQALEAPRPPPAAPVLHPLGAAQPHRLQPVPGQRLPRTAAGRETRLHGGGGRHLRRHRPRRRHPPGQPRPALPGDLHRQLLEDHLGQPARRLPGLPPRSGPPASPT
jgi:hypothetical protein